ncbi:hypothetical protein ACFPN7_38880 [Amycolatopsis halotolerans]|uniref:hypothetical protein n=1 Tax=Amycolatopsis halotolerans TaxID=330083 RepID=UPI00361C49C2
MVPSLRRVFPRAAEVRPARFGSRPSLSCLAAVAAASMPRDAKAKFSSSSGRPPGRRCAGVPHPDSRFGPAAEIRIGGTVERQWSRCL